MIVHISKFLLLFLFSFNSFSFGLENPIVEKIKAHADSASNESMSVVFSDDYVLEMAPPITYEVDENPPYRVRCAREYLLIKYTNPSTGQREQRSVNYCSRELRWFGADGKEYTVVDAFGPNDSAPEQRQTCEARGEFTKTYIHPRKAIENNGNSCPINGTISCLGETMTVCRAVMNCRNDQDYGTGDYNVYCLGTNGQCPTDIKACAADEAYDNAIRAAGEYGMEMNETRSSRPE